MSHAAWQWMSDALSMDERTIRHLPHPLACIVVILAPEGLSKAVDRTTCQGMTREGIVAKEPVKEALLRNLCYVSNRSLPGISDRTHEVINEGIVHYHRFEAGYVA